MARVLGFSHLAFNVQDWDASMDFYCNKLGLEKMFELVISDKIKEVLPDHPSVALIGKSAMVYINTGNGTFIELFRPIPGVTDLTTGGPNYDGRGFAHLSLQIDDLESYMEMLRARGVAIDSDISSGPDGTIQAWVKDPDGNRIELMEYKEDALQTRKPLQIGVNAMSLIKPMKEDFEGVVKQLKEGGIDYLEVMSDWGAKKETIDFYASLTGGSSGWDIDNTVKRLEFMNAMDFPAKGAFIFDEVLLDQAEAMGEYMAEHGIGYAVLSFFDYDVYEKIELIRKAAASLKPYGVQLCIHNHENDFEKMVDRDGQEKYVMDIFLEQLTADELMLELDTGWLLYAGVDYVKYIHEHIERVHVIHLKDICKDYKTAAREDIFVPCGKGAVDFRAVLDAVPLEHRDRVLYVLDQDASEADIVQDQIESVRYIKELSKRVVI